MTKSTEIQMTELLNGRQLHELTERESRKLAKMAAALYLETKAQEA